MRHKRIRFLYMFLVGIAISFLLNWLVPQAMNYPGNHRLYDLLLAIGISLMAWEGNLRIDSWMNQHYPWVDKPGKRLLVHLPAGLLYSVLIIYLPLVVYHLYICKGSDALKAMLMVTSLTIGLLITIIILSIEISSQFF